MVIIKMAIDLGKYILENNKPQKFIVKIAQNVDKSLIEYMRKMLEYKGMTSMTPFKELPFQPNPIDFPRLKDFIGTVYESEMTFEYPMTESLLRSEVSNMLDIGFSYIVVRKEESPLEEYIEDYLTIEDEQYENDLLDKKFGNVDITEWYGEEYNKELVKAQSKHSSSVENQYEEIKLDNE